jgi:hypothetical protein
MGKFIDILANVTRAALPNRVTFDDQSYVELFTRESLLYAEENGRKMEIMWDFQNGRVRGRVLRSSDIDRWDVPFAHDPLSVSKKAEIQDKIIEYCRRRRIPLTVVE